MKTTRCSGSATSIPKCSTWLQDWEACSKAASSPPTVICSTGPGNLNGIPCCPELLGRVFLSSPPRCLYGKIHCLCPEIPSPDFRYCRRPATHYNHTSKRDQ